jgi:hypothetical protein
MPPHTRNQRKAAARNLVEGLKEQITALQNQVESMTNSADSSGTESENSSWSILVMSPPSVPVAPPPVVLISEENNQEKCHYAGNSNLTGCLEFATKSVTLLRTKKRHIDTCRVCAAWLEEQGLVANIEDMKDVKDVEKVKNLADVVNAVDLCYYAKSYGCEKSELNTVVMRGKQGPRYRNVCQNCRVWMSQEKLIEETL